MIVKNDKYFQIFLDALKNYDIDKAFSALDRLSLEEVICALRLQLISPGAFQVRGNRGKRDKFFDRLLNSKVLIEKHIEAHAFVLSIRCKIKKIEDCFDRIRRTLPECDISKYPDDVQFWSHIERALQELKYLEDRIEQALLEMEEQAKENGHFFAPEILIIKDDLGNDVDADAMISTIIDNLSLTLKMLSYEHNWYSDDKIVGPHRPNITAEHIYKAGSIQLYAQSWSALEDIANRTLFFNGRILNFEESEIPLEGFPETLHAKFKNKVLFDRLPTEIEGFDLIANRRFISWMHQNNAELLSDQRFRRIVLNEGEKIPTLQENRFISIDEAITLYTLSEFLSFDIFSDDEQYHGLTMREWVRGYSSLKILAESESANSGLLTFEKKELEKKLRGFNIPNHCISTLIGHLTFGRDSRDLWDSPLIRSQDDKFTVLVRPSKTSNIPNVILSKLSSLTTQFGRKGKCFEDKVVSFFRKRGYRCESQRFSIEGSQYEYDALLLLDDTLFLIECKNTTISGNNAVQTLRYANFILDAVRQVQRLEVGIKERPEIVESIFGKNISELNIVPLILNSLTYSRSPIDGVYISDYSALSKFFDENSISVCTFKDGEKIKREIVRKLWSGERPTAKEFLDYLSFPPQVEFMFKHFMYKQYIRPTSEESLFVSGVLDIDETALLRSKQEVL